MNVSVMRGMMIQSVHEPLAGINSTTLSPFRGLFLMSKQSSIITPVGEEHSCHSRQ